MDVKQLNGIALAYVGDAIYEVYIRDFLLQSGQTRSNILHKMATFYVSAKAQAKLAYKLLDQNFLSEEEASFYRRGRNAKFHTKAKNTDHHAYSMSTGFESLLGYLHLTKQKERLEELIAWCIEEVGEVYVKDWKKK